MIQHLKQFEMKHFNECKYLRFIKIQSNVEILGDSCLIKSSFEWIKIKNHSNFVFENRFLFNQSKTDLLFCVQRGISVFIPSRIKSMAYKNTKDFDYFLLFRRRVVYLFYIMIMKLGMIQSLKRLMLVLFSINDQDSMIQIEIQLNYKTFSIKYNSYGG